jgi:hypothetical protein
MVACNNDPQQFDPIYTVVISCSSGYISRPPKGLQKTVTKDRVKCLSQLSWTVFSEFFATFVGHMDNSFSSLRLGLSFVAYAMFTCFGVPERMNTCTHPTCCIFFLGDRKV